MFARLAFLPLSGGGGSGSRFSAGTPNEVLSKCPADTLKPGRHLLLQFFKFPSGGSVSLFPSLAKRLSPCPCSRPVSTIDATYIICLSETHSCPSYTILRRGPPLAETRTGNENRHRFGVFRND